MAFEPRLKPPPRTPNCVSSLVDPRDSGHWIAPFALAGDPAEVLGKIRAVIEAMPRAEVVAAETDYLHVVFTTALFRWRDDLEVQLDPDAGVVHVRSASRVGRSDLGANRKRVEAIRAALVSR